MKKTIVFLTFLVSTNTFAYSVVDLTVLTSALPFISSASTSSGEAKQAETLLNDAQAFFQNGTLTVFLQQKIKETQSLNEGASEADAIEMLIEEAEAILK